VIAEDLAYCGLSCPHVGQDKPLLELLVADHAREVVRAFIKRYAGDLERCGTGVEPMLTSWLSRNETFETVWNSAFGHVHALLLSQAGDLERCACTLGLRLHECGHAGEWRIHLPDPVRFRFDRWLLPPAHTIEVSATPQTVSIHTQSANGWERTTFQRSGDGWSTTNADALPVFIRPGTRWTVLTTESLSPALAGRLLNSEVYDFSQQGADKQTDLLMGTCDGAVSVISEFADLYLPWVSGVLRDLIPLPQAKPGMVNSGSDRFSPGVICVSNQHDRWVLAETLVHEATHHYLYILERLGPFEDGTDQTLYFSPFRNMGRPIYFILLAYHAFANVFLFYRMAWTHGLGPNDPRVRVDQRLQKLGKQLEIMEQALQATTALTPLGRALWEPLHERIRS
jgi:hypothetical protein